MEVINHKRHEGTRRNYDLVVIGGGPAGTAAALTAARTGAQVVLLERGRFPRHKVCGEFVSAESLALLSSLLDSGHAVLLQDSVRIPQARMFLDRRTLRTDIDPPAASIARLDLDNALWCSAESCGVEARQQVTVQRVSRAGLLGPQGLNNLLKNSDSTVVWEGHDFSRATKSFTSCHSESASSGEESVLDVFQTSGGTAEAVSSRKPSSSGNPRDETFRVSTSAGEFEARAVINASGRWSNLTASPSGNGKVQEKWLGLKAHFSEPSPEVSVDLYFFEGGYCGVQPVSLQNGESRVNACAMVQAGVASTLDEVFAAHPALQERSRSWLRISDVVSTSPLMFRDPEPERDSVLMAGDAAGFVDPFVGDGISLALRSGALAAESLMPFFRGEISLAEAVSRYRWAYEQQLAPVFRASSKIRRALLLPKAVRSPVLFVLSKTPAFTRLLVNKTR